MNLFISNQLSTRNIWLRNILPNYWLYKHWQYLPHVSVILLQLDTKLVPELMHLGISDAGWYKNVKAIKMGLYEVARRGLFPFYQIITLPNFISIVPELQWSGRRTTNNNNKNNGIQIQKYGQERHFLAQKRHYGSPPNEKKVQNYFFTHDYFLLLFFEKFRQQKSIKIENYDRK